MGENFREFVNYRLFANIIIIREFLVFVDKDTVPLTSKWTNTRGRLAGNPGVILSCPRNRVSLTAGRCEYRVHHALVRIRASAVYARTSHTTTT